MKTGKIVIGSVHDCNRKQYDRMLKQYDPQLYTKWNPEKNKGVGLWEVRRRPNQKTAVPMWEVNKTLIFDLQYVEADIVHHVLDLPALNYNSLDKIKSMDTWAIDGNYVDHLEYEENRQREIEFAKNKADLQYNLRYHKRAISDFKELVRSGRNPADFLTGEW